MNNQDLMTERYGKKPANAAAQRKKLIAVAIALLAVFLVWSIYVTIGNANKITAAVHSFEVLSDQQTKVTYNVTNPGGGAVRCGIQVLNSGYEVVGYREVEITETEQTTVVNTVKRGVTGVVEGCWAN